MPPGQKQCDICQITFSVSWRKNDKGQVVCNSCSVRPQAGNARRSSSSNVRKSAKSKGCRKNVKALQLIKGKGRRSLFKQKVPVKAPIVTTCFTTTESLFYKSQYFQVGDVVSITEDEIIYYAKISGLIIDEGGVKYAYIHWLLPTNLSAGKPFDPSTYYLGPYDSNPMELEHLTMICNAPESYYKPKAGPFDVIATKKESGFIWADISSQFTRSEPVKIDNVETESLVCSTASETDVTSEV